MVVGAGYRSGPRAVAALRRAGMRVTPIALGRGLHAGCTGAVPAPSRDLIAWLERTSRTHLVDVVLPTTEDVTRLLALASPTWAGATVAGPDDVQYSALCDKGQLGETCRRVGVAHPHTVVVTHAHEVGAHLPCPAVVKVRDSGEAGDALFPVLVTDDASVRDARLREMCAHGVAAVVQEVVRGPAWVLHGVRDRGGRTCVVAAEALTTWPRRAGVSSLSRVDPAADALAATATPLLDAVGYVGPWCINGFERDGRLVVHDVNLRVAASLQAAIAAGLDIPTLAVNAAMGDAIGTPPRPAAVTYASTDGELRGVADAVRRRAWGQARATLGAWARPGVVRDPAPTDPRYVVGVVEGAMRRVARRACAAVRR